MTRFPILTDRDREVYEAHSAVEADGMASTRQIAEALGLPVAQIARRLVGMARRGMVAKADDHYWDGTADWMLSWSWLPGERDVPDHIKFDDWLAGQEL